MVIAAAKAGMLGFFGAAGLMPNLIEQNVQIIKTELKDLDIGWGVNLIHSPQELHLEEAAVDIYLKHNVRCVSASAFMSLSPAIVRYAYHGLKLDATGNIVRPNRVLAKISRLEVAQKFMAPAPTALLEQLVQAGKLSEEEARLAAYLPIAEDITVEADSGGHTDNRPLTALFPIILQAAEEANQRYQYQIPIRVGAAGGLGTPSAVAAAFSLGAAYVLTGSVNQSAIESGLSVAGREMLARADLADVMMAPAADMFELGVKLQVLKRETLFAIRASKLYELYTRYNALEEIPKAELQKLEQQIFQASLEQIWQSTKDFFMTRDPKQIDTAEKNPKYKMALVFRWYLGLSSQWAIRGDTARKMDYQIWCGPAMGAFNDWVKDSFLQDINNRTVEQIGKNLLEGACAILRAQQLRSFGVAISQAIFEFKPRLLA
jgi:PfaD family protein